MSKKHLALQQSWNLEDLIYTKQIEVLALRILHGPLWRFGTCSLGVPRLPRIASEIPAMDAIPKLLLRRTSYSGNALREHDITLRASRSLSSHYLV